MTGNVMNRHRDGSLEAIRGIAACVVVGWHCLLGFYPDRKLAAGHSLWFGLLNGPGAVVVFFTLSGFVLTRRYFLHGNETEIVKGTMKRWPRLLGPVLLTVLLSWFLFKIDAYQYVEASELTKSDWLRTFAYGVTSENFRPKFLEALGQGIAGTFFKGTYSYDSSLWTMRYELIGSFVVFGFALVGLPLIRLNLLCYLFFGAVIFSVCFICSPFFASFLVGALAASLLPEEFKLNQLAVIAMVLIGLLFMSSSDMSSIKFVSKNYIMIQTVAALLFIVAALSAESALRKILGGATGRFLGWLSFPLYLVHVLVLCSIGCFVFLKTGQKIPAIAVTVATSIVLAIPIGLFNDWWVARINGLTTDLLRSNSAKRPL